MSKFKVTGKTYESPKGHYVIEKEHKMEARIDRLESKLDKHIALPESKAHHPVKSQADAGIPALRK